MTLSRFLGPSLLNINLESLLTSIVSPPKAGLYVPTGQSVGEALPVGQYWPMGQAWLSIAPTVPTGL